MVAVAVVALVLFAARLRAGEPRTTVVVREPVAFNLVFAEGLRRVAPRPGEVLRLESVAAATAPQSLAVTPLRLAPYRGDVTATLMGRTPRLIDGMRASLPGFVGAERAREHDNEQPGYEILYQFRRDGRLTYGRRVLLVADAESLTREGIDDDVPGRPLGCRAARRRRRGRRPAADAAALAGFGTERP